MRIDEIEPGEKNEITHDMLALRDEKLKHYYELVETNCKDALNACIAANNFLYRGVKKTYMNAFHGKSRNNRRAMSTLSYEQEKIDAQFANHGFTALRSNSIYCSGYIKQADLYGAARQRGSTYMVFPLNGFSFTWSPMVQDLFGNIRHDMSIDDRFVPYYDYRDTDLPAAIRSHNEVMIHGEYYAFRYDLYYDDFARRYLK